MVRYCYTPSKTKPLAELDPSPELWPKESHPPLWEACQPPVTARCLAEERERVRLSKAERGKKAPKFSEADLWPIVIRENIFADEIAAEAVMAYAKRCGGRPMFDFCFKNFGRLGSLVQRCWAVETCEHYVERHAKSRADLVHEKLKDPCVCEGKWYTAALHLLEMNGIPADKWRDAMMRAITLGRVKGNLVCHVGKEGNEGKSFMFTALVCIFGPDGVFSDVAKTGFPLYGLEKTRVACLDDWRFNEDLLSYRVQLLWFEGKPIVIARPQNHHDGYLKYCSDAPVFISTLEADLTSMMGKKIQEGDLQMMLKRLDIFRFYYKIENIDTSIKPCGRCFACLLLDKTPPYAEPKSANATGSWQAGKRGPPGPTGETPPRKKVNDWSIEDVLSYLDTLGLGHLKGNFAQNGVDGADLMNLSEDDLIKELELTTLQARKVKSRLAS